MNDDSDAKRELSPGWRREWRPPKARGGGTLPVARAREGLRASLDAPLPSLDELRDEALRVLRHLAVDGGGPDAGARVGAARALLEATKPPTSAELALYSEAELDQMLEDLLLKRLEEGKLEEVMQRVRAGKTAGDAPIVTAGRHRDGERLRSPSEHAPSGV